MVSLNPDSWKRCHLFYQLQNIYRAILDIPLSCEFSEGYEFGYQSLELGTVGESSEILKGQIVNTRVGLQLVEFFL